MVEKSRSIIYGTEDKPSFLSLLALGAQLLVKFSIMVMFPLLVAEYAGASPADTANFISMSLIAGATGTLVQAILKPRISAGQLLPTFTAVPYFLASLSAAQTGGLGLVLGMTIFGSLVQLLLTPLIRRFRFIFTKDNAAFILIMLGFWLGVLGVQELFNPGQLGQLTIHHALSMDTSPVLYNKGARIIGFVSLAIMIMVRLWSPQKLRLYCILIGMLIGWGIAYWNEYIPAAHLLRVTAATWGQFPEFTSVQYSFNASLVMPFLLAAVITCFEFFALACANQKGSDTSWIEPDLNSVRRGNICASANSLFAGLIGSVAQNPLPGAVGVSVATGVYSRRIAYVFALLLFLLSFSPKMIAVFLTIPAGVNGAGLVFIGASLFMLGVNMMDLQRADSRKTYAMGIAFLIAASGNIIPAIYNPFPRLGVVATDPALLLGLFFFVVLTVLFSFKPVRKGVS